MEQLLCHLVADYWLQNDWMATNKKKKWLPTITGTKDYAGNIGNSIGAIQIIK